MGRGLPLIGGRGGGGGWQGFLVFPGGALVVKVGSPRGMPLIGGGGVINQCKIHHSDLLTYFP